ncbi:MAG: ComEA family DNA-binding protein [Gammaproteobacteria bacterium]|nr:ComEA family DNA-binding protein [Gammaproteobacteria bacterium]
MDTIKTAILAALLCVSCALPAAQAVNINTAGKAELMAVRGIGEKRAEAIIAYREQHGPFKSVDDLENVQGIGPAILKDNRDGLTVGEAPRQ